MCYWANEEGFKRTMDLTFANIKNKIKKQKKNKYYLGDMYGGFNKINVFHIFCISIMIRFLMAIAIQTPEIIDELAYKTMAQSYFDTASFDSYSTAVYAIMHMPNILYSFMISCSFYFKENFYIVIKLINSLLVSATVFPLYGVLKSFGISDLRRKICLILVLCMPFNLLCAYSMPESLYFFLVATYIFFMNQYIVKKQFRYILYAAISVVGLFLTKPHGIAIFLAMTVTIVAFKIFECKLNIKRKTLIEGGLAVIIIIAAMLLAYRGLPNMGNYGSVIEKTSGVQILDFKKWALLILGHVEIVLFFYFIPVIYLLKSFVISITNNDEHLGKLTLTIIIAFLATFSMVMLFSNTIAGDENYLRLHARYYYFFYAFFLLIFICTSDKIRFTQKQNIIIALGAWIVGIGFIKFVPRYLNGLNYSDNLDLSAYVDHPQLIAPVGILFILLSSAIPLFKLREDQRIKFYVAFLMGIFLIGNIGQLSSQIAISNTWKELKNYSELVKIKITEQNAPIFQIGSSNADQLVVSFFNQFNYMGSYTTSAEDIIKDMNMKGVTIPLNSEYIVSLKGPIEVGNYDTVEKEGNCYIYKVKQEALAEQLPTTELSNEAKVGLFNVDKVEKTPSDTVRIIGWALDSNANKTAGGVFAKCGEKIYKGIYEQERLDVDKAFSGKGNLINSGFEIEIPLKDIQAANFEYTLIILSNDKTYKYVQGSYIIP